MLRKKEVPAPLSPKKQKLADKIHEWANLDPEKEREKFDMLFKEIWEIRFSKKKR